MARIAAFPHNASSILRIATELMGIVERLKEVSVQAESAQIEKILIENNTSTLKAISELNKFHRLAEMKVKLHLDAARSSEKVTTTPIPQSVGTVDGSTAIKSNLSQPKRK